MSAAPAPTPQETTRETTRGATRRAPGAGRTRNVTGAQLVVGLAAAVAAMLALTVSVPIMRSALRHAATTNAATQQVRQQTEDTLRVNDDARAADRLAELRTALPSTMKLGALLVRLQETARLTGATWVSSTQHPGPPVRVGAGTGTAEVATYSLTVELKADHDQAAAFITRLHRSDRLLVVDSVTVFGTDTTTVTVNVFAIPDPDEGRR